MLLIDNREPEHIQALLAKIRQWVQGLAAVSRETYWFLTGQSQWAPRWCDRLPEFFWPLYQGHQKFKWLGIVISADSVVGETLFMCWRRRCWTVRTRWRSNLCSYLYNLYRIMWWMIGLAIWIREGHPKWSLVNKSDPDTRQRDGWRVRFGSLRAILTQGWALGVGDILGAKDTLCYLWTIANPRASKLS